MCLILIPKYLTILIPKYLTKVHCSQGRKRCAANECHQNNKSNDQSHMLCVSMKLIGWLTFSLNPQISNARMFAIVVYVCTTLTKLRQSFIKCYAISFGAFNGKKNLHIKQNPFQHRKAITNVKSCYLV